MTTIEANLSPAVVPALEAFGKAAPISASDYGLRADFPAGTILRRRVLVEAGDLNFAVFAERSGISRTNAQSTSSLDRWSLRSLGADIALSLSERLSLVASGSASRMKRRQGDDFSRMSTQVMRLGLGLLLDEENRLALDFVSVTRSPRSAPYLRLAETLSGAPLAGRGPELSFETRSGDQSGASRWRFSLASLQRSDKDFGFQSNISRQDMRAMANVIFKL